MNKKEKEQKLKELSNKYFWEQKATEIYLFIFIIAGFILAWCIASSIILMISPEGICNVDLDTNLKYNCTDNVFFTGFVGLLIFVLGGLLLFGIGSRFYMVGKFWIESNKEKASKRAKKELGIKDEEYYY